MVWSIGSNAYKEEIVFLSLLRISPKDNRQSLDSKFSVSQSYRTLGQRLSSDLKSILNATSTPLFSYIYCFNAKYTTYRVVSVSEIY